MNSLLYFCFGFLFSAQAVAAVAPAVTQVTWYGHAAFQITTPKGKILLIDPWLTNPMNPYSQEGRDPINKVKKLDYLLITHGHFDHVGDAVTIAKRTNARLVAPFELGDGLLKVMDFPEHLIGFETLVQPGGQVKIAGGEVTVIATPALHGSGLSYGDNSNKEKPMVYGGIPVGYVLKIEGGPTIYHSGDTAFFSDMSLIGEHKIDLALMNIGGHFGMEPAMAARACGVIHPKLVIPQHYKTFPTLTQDPKEFFKLLSQKKILHHQMKAGETVTFEGKKWKK